MLMLILEAMHPHHFLSLYFEACLKRGTEAAECIGRLGYKVEAEGTDDALGVLGPRFGHSDVPAKHGGSHRESLSLGGPNA